VTVLLARAEPDLAAGRYSAPAWLILTVAGVVAVFAAAYLYFRFRRAGGDKR
jgi:hypothetical protein